MGRRVFRKRRIFRRLGENEYEIEKQKKREAEALKDPLANSVNRGQEIKDIPKQDIDVGIGLNDVSVDFTNRLNQQTNKKDKLKRMLSL